MSLECKSCLQNEATPIEFELCSCENCRAIGKIGEDGKMKHLSGDEFITHLFKNKPENQNWQDFIQSLSPRLRWHVANFSKNLLNECKKAQENDMEYE